MDRVDAYRLLDEKVQAWEGFSFSELTDFVGEPISEQVTGSAQKYIVESTLSFGQDQQTIVIDLMIAAAGSGPLKRIDRTVTIDRD